MVAPKRSEITSVVDKEDSLSDLAEFLPKSYRGRAKILLHYLHGHIRLNEQQRVVYPNDQVGSHILDLVKYFVSPFPSDRPLDAPKFTKLMTQAGVPSSALAKKAAPGSKQGSWQHLF